MSNQFSDNFPTSSSGGFTIMFLLTNCSFHMEIFGLQCFLNTLCYLVTPENPQRCNSVIAKRSIQLYFYVSLFTLGVIALVNTVFENCPT